MRRTEEVPITEPAGSEDRIDSDVAGSEESVAGLLVVVNSELMVLSVSDVVVDGFRRTSASRGSSRGKIAPIVRRSGNCVGMSVL